MDSSISPVKYEPDPAVTTVIIADDHPVVRKALRDEMAKDPGFKVLAEAGDGEEAVRLTRILAPRVVTMDIGMPKLNGIEATRQVKMACPDTIVLVLTVYDDIEHIMGILEAGADGYLMKNISVEDIVHSVRLAASGETVLSPQVFKQVLKYALRYNTRPIFISGDAKLTIRELEVLKMTARGMSNKQIASELQLGPRTVKSHLVDIFGKLEANSRTEAVINGLRAGFLKLEDLD